MEFGNSYVCGLVFLRLGISNFYVWGLGIFTFGGKFFYVCGLVFLHLMVSNSYVWGLLFIRLRVSFLKFGGL